MDNNTANAIILIRKNNVVGKQVTDDAIRKLIEMGDKLRAAMVPDVEIEYSELQQLAIDCSTACELANDPELDEFDFDEFDSEFDKNYL